MFSRVGIQTHILVDEVKAEILSELECWKTIYETTTAHNCSHAMNTRKHICSNVGGNRVVRRCNGVR